MVLPGEGETVKRERAHSQQPTLSAAEFRALYRRLAGMPGRGAADRRTATAATCGCNSASPAAGCAS